MITPLEPSRLARAKRAFSTRRARPEHLVALVDDRAPQAGDLVLARVTAVGQHKRLERPDGRRALLFEGDEILVCYGARYAADQFEGVVPPDLGPCDLVAAGGIAGRVTARHALMEDATTLEPLGLVADAKGRPVNVWDWRLPTPAHVPSPPTIAVVGAGMNAGKTTTAAGFVLGLTRQGWSVGTAKVTGTGAGGDSWMYTDAGADPVLDFTDAGHATTYRCRPAQVEQTLRTLHGHLAVAGVDVAVLEVADGLFQDETAALVRSPVFRETVDAVVFAAGDALAAAHGVAELRRLDLPVVAVSGLLTASPLSTREAAGHLDLPVLTSDELCATDVSARFVPGAPARRVLSVVA